MWRGWRRLLSRWFRRGQMLEPFAPASSAPSRGQTERVPILHAGLVRAFQGAGGRRRGSHAKRPKVRER